MPGNRKRYAVHFQMQWLEMEMYKGWLKEVDGDRLSAECKVCKSKIDLSNIRKAAVDSHSGGVRHKQLFQIYQNKMKTKSPTIAQFLKKICLVFFSMV